MDHGQSHHGQSVASQGPLVASLLEGGSYPFFRGTIDAFYNPCLGGGNVLGQSGRGCHGYKMILITP